MHTLPISSLAMAGIGPPSDGERSVVFRHGGGLRIRRYSAALYALYSRSTTVVVQASAKQVPMLGQETASVPWTVGGRVALLQCPPAIVPAAKPPIGPPPNGITIGQLSPIAQQLVPAEHERLERAPPAGSLGPAFNDQDCPPSLETSTELVFGAAVKGTGTAMQYERLGHERSSIAPERAGIRPADQVAPPLAL